MAESDTWESLRQAMDGLWHVQRHEDKWSTGIPDLSYGLRGTQGWIELKYLKEITPEFYHCFDFTYDHFRSDQRNWLSERGGFTNDKTYVFLQVGDTRTKTFYLWRWKELKELLGKSRFSKIEQAALCIFTGRIIPGHVVQALISNKKQVQLITPET